MTSKEIDEKYLELFILVMETAGHETGNTSYLNVENILNEEENKLAIQRAIDDDVDFRIFVTLCIFFLLKDIHGIDKLSKLDPQESLNLVQHMFITYLKKPTRKFSTTYGLPILDTTEMLFSVVVKREINGKI